MEDMLSTKIRKKVLCRDLQIDRLANLISCPWESFPNCVVLLGHANTGKTLTIEEVIGKFQWKFRIAQIDCCSCTSVQALLTSILDQLVGHKACAGNDYKSHCRVTSSWMFVQELKKAACSHKQTSFNLKKIFIILDHCENLVALNPQLPNFFTRLRELTNLRITVLMTLQRPLGVTSFKRQPFVIRFPQYTSDEMVMILCSERPERYDQVHEEYATYVKMMVDFMFRDCRQLEAIRLQVSAHVAAAMTGDLGASAMWARLSRSLASEKSAALEPLSHQDCNDSSTSSVRTLKLDMPFYSKFLMIAALLAAHIPPSQDSKLFMSKRSEGAKRKIRKSSITPHRNNRKLLGPSSFSVDRLLAIFYAIIEEPISLTVPLQTQLSSLVKLEFLREASTDLLSGRKLACTVSPDVIIELARTVDFPLEKYMSLAEETIV